MQTSKYYLTYDLRLIFCKDITFLISAKELDLETLKFKQTKVTKDLILTSYPIKEEEVNSIVKSILLGKISYMISEKNIEWILNFEKCIKKNPSMLDNEALTFNYIALKFNLLGFGKQKALEITKFYFENKRNSMNVIDIETLIDSLNEYISLKELWIIPNYKEYEKDDIRFLKYLLNEKIKRKMDFDYRHYASLYFENSKKTLDYKIYEFNLAGSPIFEGKSLIEQTENLLIFYDVRMFKLISLLINNEYRCFKNEKQFIKTLISDMKETMSLAMTSWET